MPDTKKKKKRNSGGRGPRNSNVYGVWKKRGLEETKEVG